MRSDTRKIPFGTVIGDLTVLDFSHSDNGVWWWTVCVCGRISQFKGTKLRECITKSHFASCGCCDFHKKYPSEYRSWNSMHTRCYDKSREEYPNYGGRGICVVDRWFRFWKFLEDMGPKPKPELTLERKNNDGNYEPNNCEWATRADQNRNKRRN